MNLPARNDPCPCGSGRKYKKCCMARESSAAARPAPPAKSASPSRPVEAMLRDAVQLQAAGRFAEAEAAYRKLLRSQPRNADALHRLALLYHGMRRHAEAAARLEAAVACDARNPVRHVDLGVMYEALGRDGDAQAAFLRALALQPDSPEAHVNLGRRHFGRGELEEAVAAYRRALASRPDFPAALLNLGLALQQLGRGDESVACYGRALALRPDFAEAHYNLGCVFDARGEQDAAARCYRRALELRPAFADAHLNIGVLYQRMGAHEEAARCFEEARRLRPDSMVIRSTALLAQHYTGSAPDTLLSSHRGWARDFEAPLRAGWPRHGNSSDPVRRLRIGYVSPDLCRHSVAYFIEPVLANHDRAAVEVYCYHTGRVDDVSERLAALSDRWLACARWTDAQLAERIVADGIDVLVDLAGHTKGNRLGVFARKPAPVQVGWLGYPATTGLDAMDWRLCTAATDPAGEECWHSERLYRLPRSLWCYRPREDQGAARLDPPMLGRGGEVRFGSMNNLAKVSATAFAAWAEILKAMPGSRMVMTGVAEGEAHALVVARFAAHGVGAERLLLNGRLGDAAYGELLETIDIALDPFPYNGTTTTCETLWRGVPVVSLEGERSAARSGVALLGLLGLDWLVARDRDSYVALATSLARDPARLAGLRGELRDRFERSALRDEAGFTRDLEAAYRHMWRIHEFNGG